jgi:hypothetical protein
VVAVTSCAIGVLAIAQRGFIGQKDTRCEQVAPTIRQHIPCIAMDAREADNNLPVRLKRFVRRTWELNAITFYILNQAPVCKDIPQKHRAISVHEVHGLKDHFFNANKSFEFWPGMAWAKGGQNITRTQS